MIIENLRQQANYTLPDKLYPGYKNMFGFSSAMGFELTLEKKRIWVFQFIINIWK